MDSKHRILEICAENLKSAVAAQTGGSDRIELCQALEIGGVTPSIGLIKTVKKVLEIPVFVLIRPRGGDFIYTDLEVTQMEENINTCLAVGVDGFVTGALRDGQIDREVCSQLIDAANGLPVTFHRAFDVSNDSNALETVINLGFSRVLTSGCSRTAYEGRNIIRKFIEEAKSRIIIMPGSGINCGNLVELMEHTKATEYHASAQVQSNDLHNQESVVKGTVSYPLTSCDIVKTMKELLSK